MLLETPWHHGFLGGKGHKLIIVYFQGRFWVKDMGIREDVPGRLRSFTTLSSSLVLVWGTGDGACIDAGIVNVESNETSSLKLELF